MAQHRIDVAEVWHQSKSPANAKALGRKNVRPSCANKRAARIG